jgi:hypothetical protein
MYWLAHRSARITWFWMLWFMRRPWIKNLQRKSVLLIPPAFRERAAASSQEQNEFARKYGLTILTYSFLVLYASLALTLCFQLVLLWTEWGHLRRIDMDP